MIPYPLDLYLLCDEGSPSLRPVSLHACALLTKVRVHFSEDYRRENTANVKWDPRKQKRDLTFRRTSNFILPIVVLVFSFFSFKQHERKLLEICYWAALY
jgi:hypothetical protein